VNLNVNVKLNKKKGKKNKKLMCKQNKNENNEEKKAHIKQINHSMKIFSYSRGHSFFKIFFQLVFVLNLHLINAKFFRRKMKI